MLLFTFVPTPSHDSYHYHITDCAISYFLTKTCLELPLTFAQMFVQFIIVYYMINFQVLASFYSSQNVDCTYMRSTPYLPSYLLPSSLLYYLPFFLPSFLPSFLSFFLPSFLPPLLPSFLPFFLPPFLLSYLPSFFPSFPPFFTTFLSSTVLPLL